MLLDDEAVYDDIILVIWNKELVVATDRLLDNNIATFAVVLANTT